MEKKIKAWGRMHKPSKTLEYEWTDGGNSLYALYATKGEAEMEIEAANNEGIEDMLIHVTITYAVPKSGKRDKPTR